jgi:hypothetical protein
MNAMETNQEFSPLPADWYSCHSVFNHDQRGFVVALLDDTNMDIRVYIHKTVCRWSGRRFDQPIPKFQKMAVRITPSFKKNTRIPFEALECVVLDEAENQECA